jgi:hypothetical protein
MVLPVVPFPCPGLVRHHRKGMVRSHLRDDDCGHAGAIAPPPQHLLNCQVRSADDPRVAGGSRCPPSLPAGPAGSPVAQRAHTFGSGRDSFRRSTTAVGEARGDRVLRRIRLRREIPAGITPSHVPHRRGSRRRSCLIITRLQRTASAGQPLPVCNPDLFVPHRAGGGRSGRDLGHLHARPWCDGALDLEGNSKISSGALARSNRNGDGEARNTSSWSMYWSVWVNGAPCPTSGTTGRPRWLRSARVCLPRARAGSLKVGQSIMPNCCWGIGCWARPRHHPLISGSVGAMR